MILPEHKNEVHLALAGRRIVVTRAVHQAGELIDLLRDRGALSLGYPCLTLYPPVCIGTATFKNCPSVSIYRLIVRAAGHDRTGCPS